MLKRFICLALSCAICLCGCALAEDAPALAPYTLAGFDDTQYRDWKTNAFFQRMEEATGVQFNYQQYTTAADWEKAKQAYQAGENLPDVLFKANLSSAECIAMHDAGVLIDLKPYLEENCPNLWAILQEKPEYLSAITLPDGSIVALPYITTTPVQNYMWINSVWLKNLNLKTPTTAQELVDVLTAFQTRDPNKNGKKDEIPFGFLGSFDLKFLAHAFGLVANDYNVFVEDGTVKFMPLEENYRLFVTWCRDLYQAGLLDNSGFETSSAMRQVTDSNAVATYGVILAPMAADVFRVNWATDYTILSPLIYEGKQVYRDFAGNVLRGTFAVTSACKEPEKMLQWVDFLYSDEGAVLASAGKENVDYVVDGDGTWRLTESAKNDSFFTVSNLLDGGGTAPGKLADAFQRRYGGSSTLLETVEKQDAVNALTVQPFPYYSLTQEQVDYITPLQNQIGYYVDMQLAQWVLGEKEISDESFREFETTLDEMGLNDFLAFWQGVLNAQ